MITDSLVQIVFGWPAIIASLLVSIMGLLLCKPVWIVIGGVFAIPFSWYLSGYPAIRSAAFLLPFFQVGAGYAMAKKKNLLAWLLISPLVIVIILLSIVVLSQ